MEYHISSIDKLAWLPKLNELEKLYPKIMNKPIHNGTGTGGVFDDLITWVIELLTYYNETGEVLDCHWAVGLESHAKPALRYEELFIATALALIPLVPRTIQGGILIMSKTDRLHVLFEYNVSAGEMVVPSALRNLTSDQFIRPKKIRVKH